MRIPAEFLESELAPGESSRWDRGGSQIAAGGAGVRRGPRKALGLPIGCVDSSKR